MTPLSAVIITLNEEKDIGHCLDSLKNVADEIVVVDSLSTDNTRNICKEHGVKFIEHPFEGYVRQKNWAMKQASYDYILSLDADEALSSELRKNILRVKNNWKYDGYLMNRRNFICGYPMKFTSMYPDTKMRLFDRRMGEWRGLDPHDHFYLYPDKNQGKLKGDLYHWAIHDMEEYRHKTDSFARISARAYHQAGRSARPFSGIMHSSWRWLREFIIRLGFLDGAKGWLVAKQSTRYTWLKYYYLRKMKDEK